MENRKMIVLDDDPTGIQSVHDVLVITQPTLDNLKEAMTSSGSLFYILTNSRSFSEEKTAEYHKELTQLIVEAAKQSNTDFMILSRGDSTLRGHYPLETEVIRQVLEENGQQIDGEIICPYLDGIRKTENDIHYVKTDDGWLPCGESEFAKDKSFAYHASDLKEYVEEKTKGAYKAADCISISLEDLNDEHTVVEKLDSVSHFNKVIVNCTCMDDLKKFVGAFEKCHKRYMFRCAASIVKELAHIEDRPYLTKEDCVQEGTGGLILVGSHVKKTASQLAYLKEHARDLVWIEFNQHKVLDHTLHEESLRVSNELEKVLKEDKVAVVATRRERVDFPGDDPEKQLEMATAISSELIGVLSRLTIRPRFLITKGGITSSDALTIGLKVSKEWVLGQIQQNVGVVRCLEGSKFENLPVVVFPGNVGDETTLYKVVETLHN